MSAPGRAPAELPPVTISEHDGVRYLHLGSVWVQGAMRIRKPQQVVLDYVQRMLAALLWLPADRLESRGDGRDEGRDEGRAEGRDEGCGGGCGRGDAPHAVQFGLGAGALTRFAATQLRMRTTVVEINPQVVAANVACFHLPPAAEVVVGDAADWLAQAEPASVRLLHVDLYDQDAAAPVLDDLAFYADCRAVLEEGGVMAVNLFGRAASFERSIERIAAAFGAAQVWSLRPTREGNTVVVAGRGVVVPGREALRARAAALEARFGALGLPARKWLRMVRPHVAVPPSPAE